MHNNIDEIRQLYNDINNDFIVLDNKVTSYSNELNNELDKLSLDRMKCYSMNDCTDAQLVNYFMLIYKSCDDYHIFDRPTENLKLSEIILK